MKLNYEQIKDIVILIKNNIDIFKIHNYVEVTDLLNKYYNCQIISLNEVKEIYSLFNLEEYKRK